MIGNWSVANFKSIRDKANLRFAPLTLFAGQNSAGKSTLIQSILLTAQTLQSTVTSRSVVLNGRILRLGSFQDIKSHEAPGSSISVSFSLEESPFGAPKVAALSNYPRYYYAPEYQQQMKGVGCSYAFSAGEGPLIQELQLQPRLDAASITYDPTDQAKARKTEFAFHRNTEHFEQILRRLGVQPESLRISDLSALDFSIDKGWSPRQASARFYGPVPREATTAGVVLKHFLPTGVAAAYDAVAVEVDTVFQILVDTDARYMYPQFTEDMINAISLPDVRQVFGECAIEAAAGLSASSENIRQRVARIVSQNHLDFDAIRQVHTALGAAGRKAFVNSMNAREPEIRAAIRRGRPPRKEIAPFPVGDTISFAVDYINSFFADRLKYLGPLRDEPKSVYPLAGYNDPKDVGFRGEFTAAVFDNNKTSYVSYIPSAAFPFSEVAMLATRRDSLAVAVRDWLEYIGIADSLVTEDKGKLGHELRISTTQGNVLHDLTHVGVGVSQALPIVVLSLLAEPGSTLIFEQPELHLNPRVQTRLADFFVSLILAGKQCIIETHSEYFVSRIRYISAMAVDVPISRAIRIYFVEKSGSQSEYRDVEISETGVIKNWPSGFFDETERNAAAIIEAQLRRARGRMTSLKRGE